MITCVDNEDDASVILFDLTFEFVRCPRPSSAA